MRVGGGGRHGGGELQWRQRLRPLHSAERLVWRQLFVLLVVGAMLGQRRVILHRQLEENLPGSAAAPTSAAVPRVQWLLRVQRVEVRRHSQNSRERLLPKLELRILLRGADGRR